MATVPDRVRILPNPLGVGGRNVRLGGGIATIRQYLRAGLIDEIHLAIAPVLLAGFRRAPVQRH